MTPVNFYRLKLTSIGLILLIILSAFVLPAQAAVVEGLYEAEVPVANQGKSARDEAVRIGLGEVFAKVSGKPGIGDTNEQIAEYMKTPENLLQQYLYRKLPEAQKAGGYTQLLWVRFDEKAINAALRKNGVVVWGKTRPATLVWLAVENGNRRYLVGGEILPDIQDVLQANAKRYGVALVMPLMDLEDQAALRFADVWGNFQEAIFKASERYQADAILVGRLSVTGGNDWSAKWTIYQSGQQTNWGSQSIAMEDVLSSGIIGSMEVLAENFSQVIAGDGGNIELTVQDVKSLEGYTRVSTYLQSLEQTKRVIPSTLNGTMAAFSVEVRGSAEGLAKTISLGNTLRRVDAQNPDASNNNGLVYRLMP